MDESSDRADGGPGSHNEGQSGGTENDPASGGISESSEDDEDESAG